MLPYIFHLNKVVILSVPDKKCCPISITGTKCLFYFYKFLTKNVALYISLEQSGVLSVPKGCCPIYFTGTKWLFASIPNEKKSCPLSFPGIKWLFYVIIHDKKLLPISSLEQSGYFICS